MKTLKTFENFKNNNEKVNEIFGLGRRMKNWASKAIGGNIAKIEKIVQTYEDETIKALNIQQDALSKLEGTDDKALIERLKKIKDAAQKKQRVLKKKMNTQLKQIISNQREREYAEMTKSESEMKLIDKEIEMFSKVDIDSEAIKNLEKSLEERRRKEEEKKKESIKKQKELQKKAEAEKEIELKPGKKVVYTRKDGSENKAKIAKEQEDVDDNMIQMKSLDGDNTFAIRKDNIKRAA